MECSSRPVRATCRPEPLLICFNRLDPLRRPDILRRKGVGRGSVSHATLKALGFTVVTHVAAGPAEEGPAETRLPTRVFPGLARGREDALLQGGARRGFHTFGQAGAPLPQRSRQAKAQGGKPPDSRQNPLSVPWSGLSRGEYGVGSEPLLAAK